MSTGELPDLFTLQRDLLSQWEKGLNELLVKQMSSGEFAKQAQLLGGSTQVKKSVEKLQDKLPATRGDVVRMETRLKAVEDLLGRVMGLLERLVPEQSTPATPSARRTRRYKAPDEEQP